MLDAHVFYSPPMGYELFFINGPFGILPRLVDGVQQFFATPGVDPLAYQLVCNCSVDLTSFYGEQITAINGVDITSYLTNLGTVTGIYFDPGVQLNSLINGYNTWYIPIENGYPQSDTISVTFNSSSATQTFNLVAVNNIAPPASVDDVLAFNNGSSAVGKRDDPMSNSDSPLSMLEAFIIESIDRDSAAAFDPQTLHLAQTLKEQLQSTKEDYVSLRSTKQQTHQVSTRQPSSIRRMNALRIQDAWLNRNIRNNRDWLDHLPEVSPIQNTQQNKKASKKSSAAAATDIPLVLADPNYPQLNYLGGTYWDTSAEVLSYGNASSDNVGILRITSMEPKSIFDFSDVLSALTQYRAPNGIGNDLIIDVSGNGGGYICLTYALMGYLTSAWSYNDTLQDFSYSGEDVIYYPFDVRESSQNNDLYNAGYYNNYEQVDMTSRQFYSSSALYGSAVDKTYGSRSSKYTQQFYWDICNGRGFDHPESPAFFFDKIIILSDGRCGSACSQFLSKMRHSNKVRVVTYGGWVGQPLESSSFQGGNVMSWTSDVLPQFSSYNLPWTVPFNNTADITFNFFESFLDYDSLPRQFRRIEGDWHLNYWEPLLTGLNYTDGSYDYSVLSNLYASVVPLFADMPSGLPSTYNGTVATPSPNIHPSSPQSGVPTNTPSSASILSLSSLLICILVSAILVTLS